MTRRPNTIIGVSVFVACAILAIAGWVLTQMRHDALRRSQEAAFNVSLLVERDVSRNLEVYDLSLQAVADGLRRPGVADLPPDIRRMVLFDGAAFAKDLGSLLVTDATGNVIIDSRYLTPRPVNVADRDYFQIHRGRPDAGLYVSHPFEPRLSNGGTTIALSRRLSRQDGSFAGVVVGTMRVNYFRRLFAGMNLGDNGSMALMLDDGTMLMRRPYDSKVIGRSLKGTANYTRFAQAPSGDFFGTAAIDGVERWYAFRHIAGFPLILDVALATYDIYEEWRRRAWIIGSLMVALDLLIVALAVLFAQQLKRRLAMESELRSLARTDGLTGLCNRRTFDDMAQAEWRRAQRSDLSLSLLMIDVDHFKGFNDMYGHSAGDDALAAVAACISEAIRRPGDTAARYGGEEFTVLLPNTPLDGALRIAETIRATVQALDRHHVASVHHVVTISVGVACTVGQRYATLRAFINAADAALYEAKGGGRNRVASGPDTAAPDVPVAAVPKFSK
ncbi:sensor domain-containing diguanylate cyclase [Paraburkholderia sp. SIMBA_050]|jgi:diguanylate cyclase (GGDEF)-like protein|uniref:diguanylate cyclase n=1 Tax=Paraburkholderia terricola TaxID=169427 RepID=A0A1M6YZB6_9BURK|nr:MULTISPECIES: sensor domain-containing diguanylate cyclase [Paraburkholderia]AXE94671.1 GGDEF domain-containing protein [Paraburkholderia terricola]ORC45712.1 diguanylate cyclase [Burkholderia sp. A27]SDP11007.1 diguanylate cyclase (GGDEF) domain-containing protein [Paraburkholderia sediminicola]SHL23442.1 diguanylate cyclase (GGDEF) domain-containing protein [Paraburkholderia terricola]